MAKATIHVDTTEVGDVLRELERLRARIGSLPKHVEARIERIQGASETPARRDVVKVEAIEGRFVATPGPELLCLLVDFRVLAGEG